MDLSRLADRVAVVTGAGGGLGSAVAEELARAGMVVVGVDVNIGPVEELAERLAGARGRVLPMQGDIAEEVDMECIFKVVDETLGGVAVIVNNAGRVSLMKRIEDVDFSAMTQMVNTNVLGMMLACKKAIQSMKRNNILDGHIINVSSTVGHPAAVTRAFIETWLSSVYCSTKHAVTGLSRALRAELRSLPLPGHHIRVTNLSPGTVQTPLFPESFLELIDHRVLKPGDIARAVRFVLSSPPTVESSQSLPLVKFGDEIDNTLGIRLEWETQQAPHVPDGGDNIRGYYFPELYEKPLFIYKIAEL